MFRRLDKKHAPVIESLKRRFGEATASGAMSRLLDQCEADHTELQLLRSQLHKITTAILERAEARHRQEQETARITRADADLVALAKSINSKPRQHRIDL